MANSYSAGIVTAYGAAKRGGYTGTYEQFCAEQAGFAGAAQQVRQDKESVEATVNTFSSTTVPAAVQSVTDEGTTQIGLVDAAGTAQIDAVESAGSTQVGNVNTAGETQVGLVQAEGATQMQEIEDKGEEVNRSIPEDYSALVEEVGTLNNAISANGLRNSNLIGSEGGVRYPLVVPSGTVLTMSTADRTAIGTAVSLFFLDANGNDLSNGGWGFPAGSSNRTITAGNGGQTAYYVAWSSTPAKTVQLNFGNSVLPYEEYNFPVKYTINALKSFAEEGYSVIDKSQLENGSFNRNGDRVAAATRIRVAGFVNVSKGQSIIFQAGSVITQMLLGYFTPAGVYIADSPWINTGTTTVFEADYKIVIVFRKNSSNPSVDKSEYDATTSITTTMKTDVDNLKTSVESLDDRVTALEGETGLNDGARFNYESLLMRNEIQTQYTAMPENPISFDDDAYVDVKIGTIPDGDRFAFFSDEHWESSKKHIFPLLSYVRRRTGINDVVFGGDFIDRQNTKYLANQIFSDFCGLAIAEWGFNFIPVIGNHDTNLANAIGNKTEQELAEMYYPPSQWQKIIYPAMKNIVYPDYDTKIRQFTNDPTTIAELNEYFKTVYYYDDENNHIRYVVVNTGNPKYGYVYDTFGAGDFDELWLQFDFIYNALVTTPANYNVVIAGHWFIQGSTDTMYRNPNYISRLLSALKTKSNLHLWMELTPNLPTADADLLKAWMAEGYHDFDFTGANTIGKVLMISGHIHYDGMVTGYPVNTSWANKALASGDTVNETGGEVPCVMIQTDNDTRIGSSDKYHPMTPGTTTDQCFDVITFTDTQIVMTRFGAGTDRIINIT